MIVVASTIGPWKAGQPEEGDIAWLDKAKEMQGLSPEPLHFFCAVETDARGLEPYSRLYARIIKLRRSVPFTVWQFSINDETPEISGGNRLIRICTGRNLAHEFAMRNQASHILFLDTDIEVQDAGCIGKLLELDRPVAAGHVPAYCLDGPRVENAPGDTREHWTTAGFLFLRRDVFLKLRWRWDLDEGLTDDPAFQEDAVHWGFGQTWVRHDVLGIHVEPLVPVDDRQADRTLYYD